MARRDLDLWHIVPVEAFAGVENLWFYPNGSKKGSRFEIYRQDWHLLSNVVQGCEGSDGNLLIKIRKCLTTPARN